MKKQAVTCLVMADDGKVLAVSRKHNPNDFGLPGGSVESFDESLEAAAMRELKEETGLTATKLKQVFQREDGEYICTCFLAEVEGEIDTDEAGLVRWVEQSVVEQGCFGEYNKALFKHVREMKLVEQLIVECFRAQE